MTPAKKKRAPEEKSGANEAKAEKFRKIFSEGPSGIYPGKSPQAKALSRLEGPGET